MMPNVTRGDRMAGLMVYLVGPGRHNEHENPHLVAGTDALMTWYDDNELERDNALAIARHLDKPRTVYGTEVTTGVYERQEVGRDTHGRPRYKNVRVGEKQAHVWHCSLSLRADEGELTDQQWGDIARDFITAMGFDDNEGTKAACRWAAVRHGTSTAGNDHVHIVVNLVREDGTKASTHKDFYRAQQAARALEITHGLERLESSLGAEPTATRGYTPAEHRRAEVVAQSAARARVEKANGEGAWDRLDSAERQRRMAAEIRLNVPRVVLARKVRAASTAAADEAEFVRRVRRMGLLIRPRFAEGHQDVVTGYSVAERPKTPGERPVWFGGGNLARDLTLPRLRNEWPDDPTTATAAAAEWHAAWRGHRPVAPGRETAEPSPGLWQEHAAQLATLREQLRAAPLTDTETWPRIARQAAGTLAAWSTRVEPAPGALADAADTLAKSAQTYRRQQPARTHVRNPFAGAALLISAGAAVGKGPVGQAAMMHELIGLTGALAEYAAAASQARQAAALRFTAERRLTRLHERMAGPTSTATAVLERPALATDPRPVDPALREVIERMQAGRRRAAAATSGSPLPTTLDRARPASTVENENETGAELGR
ncbi:relaxase/mobilization nuclease domain-containing protein [Antribacter gilvus]|uniref:relaxase/mobilization nuclease domain-containing protein n=1 Tax=Antribacter gilvus TaxID=2304675 RepID=UPI000F76636D|nr:relaxase/mobilization nuclease domain-containing protein [Antribacter gilvus]